MPEFDKSDASPGDVFEWSPDPIETENSNDTPEEETVTVEFMMTWTVTGKQTADVPKEIVDEGVDAVREYLYRIWDEIPLPPDDDYIPGSDELDENSLRIVDDDNLPF